MIYDVEELKEFIEGAEEDAKRWFEAEELLREAATALQLRGEASRPFAMQRLSRASALLSERYSRIVDYYDAVDANERDEEVEDLWRKADDLAEIAADAVHDIRDFYNNFELIADTMRKACSDAERVFGKAVCWHNWEWEEKGTLSMAINDVAAIAHRAAELMSRAAQRARKKHLEMELGEKVKGMPVPTWVAPGAPEKGLEICWAFGKAYEKVTEAGLVHPEDRGVQFCVARKDYVQLRLGSAAGHATQVFYDGRLRYYDTDWHVNECMKKIWEELAGCKCKETGEGVECWGCDPVKAAVAATEAISMDIRLDQWRSTCEDELQWASQILAEVMEALKQWRSTTRLKTPSYAPNRVATTRIEGSACVAVTAPAPPYTWV